VKNLTPIVYTEQNTLPSLAEETGANYGCTDRALHCYRYSSCQNYWSWGERDLVYTVTGGLR
ncbi:MAG: hypothetical protein RSA51_08130, partial [Niameybacter sp.]